jgi:lysophospholipase
VLARAPFHADLAGGPEGGHAVWLTARDGVRLRAAFWHHDGARGTVFIFPGRSESIEKYGRAAADLARRGYACLCIDWRGQGLSDRSARATMLGHVARFSDYQHDIAAALAARSELGLPDPLFLLAHSMGGAIGLRALGEGLPVRAAAFTAPMWGLRIAPSLRPVAWALATGARAVRMGQRLAPGTDLTCYIAVAPFEGNLLTTDPDMFHWMKRQVHQRPELGLGGPTLHWVHEALWECRRLRARPSPAVPAVTFLGTEEKVVDPAAIHDRMRRWPGGTIEMVARAEHEVLMETPEIRRRTFDRIVALFDASSDRADRQGAGPGSVQTSARAGSG